MKGKLLFTLNTLIWALLLTAYAVTTHAQTSPTTNQPVAKKVSAPQPSGINPAVTSTGTTDASGAATVTLPDWFEALNQDFRYQLTVIGTFAQAIVAEKVKGNRFTVKTNAPNVEVSWQVTGIRHDAYANKHRIPVEEQKPEDERGLYLHPDAFNQPEERGIQFVRNAPQIEKLNAARERVTQPSQPR